MALSCCEKPSARLLNAEFFAYSIAFRVEKRTRFGFSREHVKIYASILQYFLRTDDHVENHANRKWNSKHHLKIRLFVRLGLVRGEFSSIRVDARALPTIIKCEKTAMFLSDFSEMGQEPAHFLERHRPLGEHEDRVTVVDELMFAQGRHPFVLLVHKVREYRKFVCLPTTKRGIAFIEWREYETCRV